MSRARRHDRNVPERADSRWRRAASGRRVTANRRPCSWRTRSGHSDSRWGRLKTGTPPRLHRNSIDFDAGVAAGSSSKSAATLRRCRFRSRPPTPLRNQIRCWLLHTNDRVRDLVRANIDRSPLYNGQIQGIGPRYCPSLEDKIMRFPDRERHQLYLEPEGLDVDEIYVNGFSMSLPPEIQEKLVHALPGLEDASILRPGYAVEYDFVQPTELKSTLETHRVERLFSRRANQRNLGLRGGGGQGSSPASMLRGRCSSEPAFSLGRDEAYIGDPRRRLDHEGMPRAVPDVHVTRRAPAAASNRQRRSATDATSADGRACGR